MIVVVENGKGTSVRSDFLVEIAALDPWSRNCVGSCQEKGSWECIPL